MLAEGTILCSSKKQHTISLSSAKVKYMATVNAATQCVWLQVFFGNLVSQLILLPTFGWTIKVPSRYLLIRFIGREQIILRSIFTTYGD